MRLVSTQSVCWNWFSLTFGGAVDEQPFEMHVLLSRLLFGHGLRAWDEHALQDVVGEDWCVHPQHDVWPGRLHDEVVVYASELAIHALDLLFLVPSSHGLLLVLWEEYRVHRLFP